MKPTLLLERFAYTPVGTFGKLFCDELDFDCYTIERPWINNEKMISCIPEGSYTLRWHTSPTFGKVLAFSGNGVTIASTPTSKRSAILIHPANTIDDLKGCVGLGTTLGFYRSKWAVLNSKPTVEKFNSLMEQYNDIEIIVRQIKGAIEK